MVHMGHRPVVLRFTQQPLDIGDGLNYIDMH